MNLFGHARLASREATEPLFVLGAMLPDLQRITGARPAHIESSLKAGVAHHHRADAVFHHVPAFVGLLRDARRWLTTRGLPRGPAMALAHIGVEILLDGAWSSTDPSAEAAFRGALGCSVGSAVQWPDAFTAQRFEHVRARLLAGGLPEGYRRPEEVAERLVRIVMPRPRLAVPREHFATVRAWTRAAWPEVRANATTVWLELEKGLLETRP